MGWGWGALTGLENPQSFGKGLLTAYWDEWLESREPVKSEGKKAKCLFHGATWRDKTENFIFKRLDFDDT